jgi:hypothetical protein
MSNNPCRQIEETMYEEALVKINWTLRKFKKFLREFDETVDDKVNQQGVGKKRMEQMVNGGSTPMRKQVIEDLRKTTPNLVPKKKDVNKDGPA